MQPVNRSPSGWIALGVAIGLLGILGACSDDVVEPGPSLVPGGRISGTVRTGGEPADVLLRATRIPEKPGDVAEFEVAVDWRGPQGSFQKDLPAGRYVAALYFRNHGVAYEYSAEGLGSGDASPDTLFVDAEHSPVNLDFDLASVRVRLHVSRELDDATGIVQLHKDGAPPDERAPYVWRDGGRVVAGILDVTLAGVLPGAYRVEFVIEPSTSGCCWPHGGERFWMPGVRDEFTAPWTHVGVDHRLDVTMRIDHDPAHIQGEIVGAWLDLELSERPSVALLTPDSTVVHTLRGTDLDGSFDLQQSIPGPVKVLVEHDGVVQWVGGGSFAEAQTFELAPWGTVSGVRVVQSAIQIDLQSDGVAFTNFRLYDASTQALSLEWLGKYVGGFTVTMPNLAPGSYIMHIEPPTPGSASWISQWYDRARTASAATTIHIDQEGQVVPITVVLEPGATISGTVSDAEGVVDDYFIYITRADDPARWGDTFARSTRPDFRFDGVPDGAWKIGVSRRGSGSFIRPDEPPPGTVWFPSTQDWDMAMPITVVDQTDVTGIEIVMPAPVR